MAGYYQPGMNMTFTVTAIIHENTQAQAVIEMLSRSGIDRERVDISTDESVVKLPNDRVGSWSAGGLVTGAAIGGFTGWALMPSGVLGIVGALWCAVVGAIIGGRALGYAATDRGDTSRITPPKVVVSVQAESRAEVTDISTALSSGGAERIAWSENKM